MTDYKKVTRKSRDPKEKTKGVRMKRLTQVQVNEIKQNVLPLDKHAIMMMKFHQGQARRDRFATPIWNSMTQAERLKALTRSGVDERAMGLKLKSREELSKLSYNELPHYAKTDLGFHFFNLNREGRLRMKRNRQEVKNSKYDIQFYGDTITNQEGDLVKGFQGSIGKGNNIITAEIYPVNPNDPSDGWEYRLDGDVEKLGDDYGGRYDSYVESWTGTDKDHAGSSEVAMEWAENTAIDFLEGN